jgi:hypothetical protein
MLSTTSSPPCTYARTDPICSKHKKQMDCIKSWIEVENSRWEKILSSPQKLEETLSKRLDADRLVFSQRLNHLQLNALQSTQNSDSFRLQQRFTSRFAILKHRLPTNGRRSERSDSPAFASLPKAYYFDYLSQDVSNYRQV